MQAESGSSTTPYDDPGELADRVADDLAVLLTERFTERPVPALPGLAAGWLPTPATPLVDRRTRARAWSCACCATRPCGWSR